MSKRSGFSIIEVLLAAVLTAVVLGALTSVYSFAARTASNAAASANATRQAQMLGNEIAKVVRNAVQCDVIVGSGNTGLRCTMPANGVDVDGDGYLDTYSPQRISKRGLEKWGKGNRVWFYMANSTGDFSKPGTIVWRAQRIDDSPPTSSDCDSKWAYYYGSSKLRWDITEALTFSVDSANQLTSFSVTCSQLARADRMAKTSDVNSGSGYRTTLSRTIFWRNWRP
jgi:Tfp pilus assembly protein PilV